ncbi:hypothetical protein, partial [Candidatus Phytoplasma oryzae]|uniref:hypothetical protein n=1 Tax=Candidatus Phytoplasma oryzae TaxID=203274 RepID=UPI0011BD1FA1
MFLIKQKKNFINLFIYSLSFLFLLQYHHCHLLWAMNQDNSFHFSNSEYFDFLDSSCSSSNIDNHLSSKNQDINLDLSLKLANSEGPTLTLGLDREKLEKEELALQKKQEEL